MQSLAPVMLRCALYLILLFFFLRQTRGKRCTHPGHGVHTSTNMSSSQVDYETSVVYKCDPGFEMFGSNTRVCHLNGTWSGSEPVCALNVARRRRVVKVSSLVDHANEPEEWGKILDAYYSTCSVARTTDVVTSFWTIDLLQKQNISFVKIAFGEPIKDITFEILYGEDADASFALPVQEDSYLHTHSVFVDFEYGSKEMTEYFLWLKYPVTTRFLTVQIPAQYQRSRISLCEVAVYSATASSPEQCQFPWLRDTFTNVLDSTCYRFHEKKLSWMDARLKCRAINNGSLVSGLTETSQEFLRITLENLFSAPGRKDTFWVGGHRRRIFEGEGVATIASWEQGVTRKYFYRNPYEASGIGDALDSCLTISGQLNWMWTPARCQNNYPWICQYNLPDCGTPDRQPVTLMQASTGLGQSARYSCPKGFVLEGESVRTCLPSGRWSDTAPQCRFVDCKRPEEIVNGSVILIHLTTTYGSAAEYSCSIPGHYLIGPRTRVCQRDGKWSGSVPHCSDILPDPAGLTAVLNLETVLAISLACLGVVVMVTVITLCVVFFKKRSRRLSTDGVESNKNFLATFDSDDDLAPEKNGSILTAYDIPNGKA